jgi:hypothetical protein
LGVLVIKPCRPIVSISCYQLGTLLGARNLKVKDAKSLPCGAYKYSKYFVSYKFIPEGNSEIQEEIRSMKLD